MTLVKAYLTGADTIVDINEHNSAEVQRLLLYGTLCSDGAVALEDGEEKHLVTLQKLLSFMPLIKMVLKRI